MLMKKKLSLLMVALIAVAAFAMQVTKRAYSDPSPYSYAFSTSEKTFTDDGTKDLGGVDWTLAVTWTDDTKKDYNRDGDGGMKIGSNNKSVTAMSLTSDADAFGANYITSVKVTTAARSGANPALTVTVGGAEFKYVKDDQKLSSAPVGADKTAVYEFAGVGQGAIVINWDGSKSSSKGAIYVKQIDVAFQAEAPAGPAVAEPVFSLDGGTYAGAQSVEITCATDGASIFYTTDGTTPTAESTAYTGAISVTETTTIKAIGIKGEDKSEVATSVYTIVEKIDGGSLTAPLTIAQAKALIDTKSGAALAHPDNKVYVKAVATVGEATVDTYGQLTYKLNEGTDEFDVYQGKNLENVAFTEETKGDIDGKLVTVYGNIKKYNESYEFDRGNYVVKVEEVSQAIVYDFAAEQALIAAGTVAKPGNVGGNQNNGQGFNAYGVKIRNDYKGYSKKEGSTLPDVCHIWRRSDRFDQDASWNVAGGVAMPNNREFAIDGLTPGSKVVIEYDATNCNDDSKNIIWAVGENDKLGAAVGAGEGIPVATATIGGVEAVPGETAIASGAEILVKSVTPAVKGTGYIVVQVKKNMVISKISILVNEDAVDYAVNVSESIENGTVKVNRTTAYEGDDVYVTATPAEGYALESITVKGADETEIAVTDGKFTMPAQAVTVSATFKDKRIVYDFAAEQALIAAGTVAKPGNVGGNQNNGQGFNAYGVKIRNDYKGYSKKEGSTLPDVCHIWRRSDRFDQDASWNVAGGVAMPNNREFAIDGLTPGSKVVIEYDATNCNDDSKNIIWAVGENDKLGAAVGAGEGIPVATATIGGVEAVPGETAIASGAEILVKSVTPAVKGTGYIVVQVKKNMVISKISILVNEDAVDYAVNVSESIENGTVKVNRTTAYEGDDVYVTATPAEGYALESITVKGADETEIAVTDGKFTMPAQAVTVSATFKEIPKFYIIGDMNGWNRTAMTEMTFNAETQAYEYEYAPTTVAHLAFADYQMTEDEAAAEGSWDVFNSTYRYSLGRASDTDPNVKVSPSETALTLIKGVEGTIELNPGTYKISVAKDFSTVTITGEAAPEALVCIVAGNNPEIFGTPWDETNEANKMTKGADGKYSKTYTVTDAVKDIQLKVVTDGTWYGDATGNNVTFDMTAAGEFTVVFDPATKEVSVTGDNVKFPTDFDYTDVYAVGNGSEGWLNNKAWVPGAEENKMTKVSDGIFEITFNEVPAGENRQVKFAIDGTWDRNFGGTFAAFGEETAAVYDGGNITFNTTADLPKITIRLDLTGFDFATKQGAKFTISAASSTGINAVKADALKDAQIYTISGQRVDKAKKGLYIVNGRKVVIK